ncbi:MAG: DUF6273 domain-containing protein [Propionibacteriaceae bacterium]|jgi:hypothetical protein|nr:DUF6273 domain-containing protein [Propionibacteriaceae bacterium]
MKKAFTLALALGLALPFLTACGSNDATNTLSPSQADTGSISTPGGTTSVPQDAPLVSKVGDSLVFGTFEGKAVEWTCIDVRIDTTTNQVTEALLLSKDILFERPWDTTPDITEARWESSTLREYLGNVWVGATFSQAEINLILTSWISNPGRGTEDTAFILSTDEVEQYFATQESRIAKLSKDGAYDALDYWTRTPFSDNGEARAELVRFDGEIFKGDYGYVVGGSYGVRPAIWIDLTPEKPRSNPGVTPASLSE